MFKVGDKVRCIDNTGRMGTLTIGDTYEITSVEYDSNLHERYVRLKNDGLEYVSSRFEKVLDSNESEQDTGLIDKQEHYTANGIQPIEIMKANLSTEEYHGFLISNVWKYTFRYKRKNGLEDLKKAQTYLTWLISEVEELGDDIYWKK